MARDPIELNISGVRQLISSGLNKVASTMNVNVEGIEGDQIDEFDIDVPDEELLQLAKEYEERYRGYESKLKTRQEAQKTYYLGKQKEAGPTATGDIPQISANLLFEAEETFLPAALAKNPEPVVWCDNTTEGQAVANSVKTMLQYHADVLVLRQKLTLVTRHWSIYFLGVVKHGWDDKIKDIDTKVIDPQNLILDPEAAIDPHGDYEGEYLGERKTTTARKLVELFPKHKEYITSMVDGKMGTRVVYTEWWSDEYCFYTFKERVLDKHKNPNFNYPQTIQGMDADGQPTEEEQPGVNHFAFPKKPYTFLSVFSLGEQPHDITGLIEQNIPNQRRISRRTEQLDYNLSRANNSDVFSEDNFNQETAKQASSALAKGNPVLIPQGKPISEAILRLQAPGIGADFFNELEVSKNDLRTIFGTQGITAQQPNEDTTARGMILNQQFDNTRIGGGIGDKLEQFADNVFNWWVQLYCVHYDEPHFAAIMGQMKAVEYVELTQQDLNRRIVVSVAPDSMKPKDEVTEMNQAMELAQQGFIDPKTLLTILDFPDPQTAAGNAVLWKLDPQTYFQLNFPQLAEQLQAAQQQAAAAAAQAQAQAVGAQPAPAPVGNSVPEQPPEPLSSEPANAALSQVPLPK